MTMSLVLRGLSRRELTPVTIGRGLLVAVAAGATFGWLASRYTGDLSGTGMLIAQGDRTLAAVFVLSAIFRMITRLAADENAEWLQQLTAAGSARGTYYFALTLCITGSAFICYLAGAWAFAGVSASVAGNYEPAMRSVTTLPLVVIMLLGATSFGGLMYGVAGTGSGRGLAFLVIVFPWIVLWTVALSPPDKFPLTLVRFSALPAPPLLITPTVAGAGHVLLYSGLTLALGLLCAERRVARL